MSLGHHSTAYVSELCEVGHILWAGLSFGYNVDKFTHGRLLTCLECGF